MTPWGLQRRRDYPGNRLDWWPFRPEVEQLVCGRWIEDLPHCHTRDSTWLFRSVENNGALTAFRHGEITDPSLDLAYTSKQELPSPLTNACKITTLPTEILQKILEPLIPTNCAFQFFPAKDPSGKTAFLCVQKFVPEPRYRADMSRDEVYSTMKLNPSTGSIHMAIARTCRRLQEEAYCFLYSQNSFVFHLTRNSVQHRTVTQRLQMRSWTRLVPLKDPDDKRGPRLNALRLGNLTLGPLTPRAAAYLKQVVLVPSLPKAPTKQDLTAPVDLIARVGSWLSTMQLTSLSIVFQHELQARHRAEVISLDLLGVGVNDDGGIVLSLREPRVTIVDERDRMYKVLSEVWKPLIVGAGSAKELVLSGSMTESIKVGLEARFGPVS
jgi:hypothetical protein